MAMFVFMYLVKRRLFCYLIFSIVSVFVFTSSVLAQHILEVDEIIWSGEPSLGQRFFVLLSDSSNLVPKNYRVNYKEGRDTAWIFFTVTPDGSFGDPVIATTPTGLYFAKLFLEDDSIVRIDEYEENQRLRREYVSQDTVYSQSYSSENKLTFERISVNRKYIKKTEYITVNGNEKKEVYFYKEQKTLKYLNGRLKYSKQRKGLPDGIRNETIYYTDKGTFESKVVDYTNGLTKRFFPDKSCEIEVRDKHGLKIEKYNSAGKLLSTEDVTEIMMPD